ncbi:UPF0175 family protein [Tellurirhabdus rosea]|uniref:UPF0175 family protein n=1 Tax=Tellurirhabdus rosea TaxID=2674997 RepID=UPI00225909FE|nr:UPF0175 family protein [Tellurirhabdus rosea]
MKTIEVQIPDWANEGELLFQIAGMFFAKGVLSSGQAAEMAGITKAEFLEKVGQLGVSIFGETPEDIANL